MVDILAKIFRFIIKKMCLCGYIRKDTFNVSVGDCYLPKANAPATMAKIVP